MRSSENKLHDKSINAKFKELSKAIKEDWAKYHTAQGSNSIILVYPPKEEEKYLKEIKKHYPNEYYIDISELFVKLIDEYNLENFKEAYKNYKSTPEVLFNSPQSDQLDLNKLIIDEIKEAFNQDKLPIMIRTGMLYGTNLKNKFILEHKIVQISKKPLIIMYPATIQLDYENKERIWFLDIEKASDYRGYII